MATDEKENEKGVELVSSQLLRVFSMLSTVKLLLFVKAFVSVTHRILCQENFQKFHRPMFWRLFVEAVQLRALTVPDGYKFVLQMSTAFANC